MREREREMRERERKVNVASLVSIYCIVNVFHIMVSTATITFAHSREALD